MPEYPFRTPAGEIVHRAYRMSEAPSIGDTVDIAGQACVRVASTELHAQGESRCRAFPYESNSLPHSIAHNGDAKLSARGKVIIRSKQHRAEVCAKYGYMVE